jgi:hypothetical protein
MKWKWSGDVENVETHIKPEIIDLKYVKIRLNDNMKCL